MSEYNRQQREAILMVRAHLATLEPAARQRLEQATVPYLEFRGTVAAFQTRHLFGHCRARCFARNLSACCGREGILTFFADHAVNLLLSTEREADTLLSAIEGDPGGEECVYLREQGCVWRLKPIVCEMFHCEAVKDLVTADPALAAEWEELREREKDFTLPSKPVLFDDLEREFLDAGVESPLMYCHRSPGLLRLKKRHGVRSVRR